MSLTITEYRQFITETKFLTKQKEYCGFLNKYKLSFRISSNPKTVLHDTKESYNYTFINICNKYGFDTDEIYKDLDKAWNNGPKIADIPTMVGAGTLQYVFYEYKKKTLEIAENHAKRELETNE